MNQSLYLQESKYRPRSRNKIAKVIGTVVGASVAVGLSLCLLTGPIDDAAVTLQTSVATPLRQVGEMFATLQQFRRMEDLAKSINTAQAADPLTSSPAISKETKAVLDDNGDSASESKSPLDSATDLLKSAAHPTLPPVTPALPIGAHVDSQAPVLFNPTAILNGARSLVGCLVGFAALIGLLVGFLASKVTEALATNRSWRLPIPEQDSSQPIRQVQPQLRIVNTGAAQSPLPPPRWVGQELETRATRDRVSAYKPRPRLVVNAANPKSRIRRYIEI